MPTYVYACERCGEFEAEQSITAPALARCPTCDGAVRRLLAGGTSVLVKGQGAAQSRCARQTPCCGRESRCDRPPCRDGSAR